MPTPLDRPRLRRGLAAARDADDPQSILVFDERRVSRTVLSVGHREFAWMQFLDGTTTLRDVQSMAMRRDGNTPMPLDDLLTLVERLDDALFLDGARFEAYLHTPVREPSCLGCYAPEPDELRRQLAGYFTAPGGPGLPEPTVRSRRLRALLAPHIDYGRGGVSYAHAYKELAEQTDASLFVVVGTSHYGTERFMLTRQDFKTPLGVVPTDQGFIDRVVAHYGDGLFDDPAAHVPEHSIELEVVFLQYLFERVRPIRIVPLLVGSFADCLYNGVSPGACDDIARMVEALAQAERDAGEPVSYVISGDLAHIGPKFGDAGPLAPAFLADSRAADAAILKRAEAVDADGYFRFVAEERDARRICGLPPTYTTLAAARPTSARLLHYDQYVHPRGSESVSFASMAFYV